MKRLCLAIALLLAISIALYIAIPALNRASRAKEMKFAVKALAECYRFVFAGTMDKVVLGQPSTIPANLSDAPGWTDYVNKADSPYKALYKRVDWHPPQTPSVGQEIASIELTADTRAVLLYGGSAYFMKKWENIEQGGPGYPPQGVGSPDP